MKMSDILRQTLEYQEGRAAYQEGERRAHNPYAAGDKEGSPTAWWMGWDDQEAEYKASHPDEDAEP